MIYFDNAATTFPKPPRVVQAVQRAMVQYGANPGRSGHDLSIRTAEQVYRCRELAAQLFHCDPEQVIFTKNCTESLNLVLKGILRPGDHLIISDLEHNAVYRVADALARRGFITYSVAKVVPDDALTVLHFERLIRKNTRLIVCTQGSNVFGTRVPVEKIGAMAHQRRVLMAVDAAQTAGLLDIDLKRDAIDYLCMPGHKGLYGPMGTGLLLVNSKILPAPILEGGTGSLSMQAKMPDFLPDMLEAGTVNVPGILGLAEGIAFVLRNTPQKLYQKEMALCGCLYDGLNAIEGVSLYTPRPKLGESLPVLALNIGALDSDQAGEQLNRYGIAVRAGFHCAALAHRKMGTAKAGVVRASLGAFNTQRETAQFCAAVRSILRDEQGKNVGNCKKFS